MCFSVQGGGGAVPISSCHCERGEVITIMLVCVNPIMQAQETLNGKIFKFIFKKQNKMLAGQEIYILRREHKGR